MSVGQNRANRYLFDSSNSVDTAGLTENSIFFSKCSKYCNEVESESLTFGKPTEMGKI